MGIITFMSLSSNDFLVLLWSAGIEDVKQVSREVLSFLLFFFLLPPLKVTYQTWKEVTHQLITLFLRP